MTPIKVTHGQKALIAGVKNDGVFTFGSVEGYARQNNEETVNFPQYRKDPEVELKRAQSFGHEIAWALPETMCIVDSKTYPDFYPARDRERAAALRLKAGDMVEIEGRAYTLAAANNQNVRLVPVYGISDAIHDIFSGSAK